MTQKLKNIKDPHSGQFQYLGRWVDKETFRAWIYDKHGEQKLAGSYKEFEDLTSSGIWFAKKPEIEKAASKERKLKDVICANGQTVC
jgi:hypothetical protein